LVSGDAGIGVVGVAVGVGDDGDAPEPVIADIVGVGSGDAAGGVGEAGMGD
jgi:hypothetical protein